MSRRMRLALVSGGIAVALVLLMVTAIRAAATYYYTLPQFRALGAGAVGHFVQVNGTVGSPHWDPLTEQLTFTVLPPAAGTSSTSAAQAAPGSVTPLPVVYHGPEPSTFTSGISVVVAGVLAQNGTFQAHQVLVKCPSTYTAAAPGQGAQWSSG